MVFQIVQDSVWHYIFGVGSFLLIPAIVAFMIFSKLEVRLTLGLVGLGSALVVASVVGAVVVDHQRGVQNDASFSKQLMDEYGVTSSRSFYEIQLNFYRFDEARTVFTKDGKDIPVYIKLVHSDNKQAEMVFTVVDEKSLFPKLTR